MFANYQLFCFFTSIILSLKKSSAFNTDMKQYFGKFTCLFICFSSLILLIPKEASSQNFNIETFTTKEGLVNDNVRALAVDSSGYLWIGTWDGISRYDGYSFTNYFHNPNDSLSLPYFSIFNILVDGGNNLWLITDDGIVAIYDRYNDRFTRVDHLYRGLPASYTHISTDESGYLWLINPDSIFRFDFSKDEFNRYKLMNPSGSPLKILQGHPYSISTCERNKIWLVCDIIYEFEKSSDDKLVLRKEYLLDSKTALKNFDFNYGYWYRIYHSESGKKWIFSNAGLFLLEKESVVFSEFKNPFPEEEFPGNDFLSWSWYEDGIYIYDPKETKLSHVPHEYCQLTKRIFCQNKNLVWFSNNSMTGAALGFSKVVFTPDYFKNYPLIVNKNDIPSVYSVTRDRDNRIWVGMRGRNPVIQITPDMKVIKLDIPNYSDLINPGAVRSLNVTNDGLWIGFFRELLIFYDFNTGNFTRHYPESNLFRPVTVNKKGELYFCKDDGMISLYNPELKMTEKISDFRSLSPIYKIFIDDNDLVWAGTNQSALIKIDPFSKKSAIFFLSKDNYNIEDICQGDGRDLWLTLLGGGVCRYNPDTGEKKFYTTSNGLANNITYGLLKDKEGNIWVSTNNGISRINPQTGIIRNFGLSEGLKIIEFNSGAVYAGDNGEFLLGGMGGLVGFYPDTINRDELETGEQKIIINEIRVSGKAKRFIRYISKPDTVILNKGENNFKVYFSSTDFIHSDKTVYRYMLSKVNENWVESDSRNRSVSYANLSPGWYNFQLQATDRAGSWRASKEIAIRIKPFYYQTLLFRIAVPLIFLFLITSIIIFYIHHLKQREAQKQDALRLQTLRGQMNPHFIFNSLNSINYFISRNDKLSANRYISDFSKLIRSILYNMDHDFITIEKEIESLREYLKIEYLRFGDKFDYEIFVDPEIEIDKYRVSSGLIQPFIENAIWHGLRGLENRKGKIILKFSRENSIIVCIIEDDGIGRRKSESMKSVSYEKESRGISIVNERLKIINKLMKGSYQVTICDLYPDRTETGTKVGIDLPVLTN
jgi:sugar lactone lactonase YvrE